MDLLGLINQMRGMGFFTGFEGTPSASDIAGLSGTDIMNVVRQTYQVPEDVELTPEMFSTFDMNKLLGGMQKTYSPQLEAASGSLLSIKFCAWSKASFITLNLLFVPSHNSLVSSMSPIEV